MRYKRQIKIVNQELLTSSHVIVIGAGGLGSAALYYLAAAGIGKITIVDSDDIDESNLNRQILHFTDDIGKPKVLSALRKLLSLNPEIQIDIKHMRITPTTVDLLPEADLIVDCLDNMDTRFVLNKFCVKKGIPIVHAAVEAFEGRLTVIIPGKTPCLACIYAGVPLKKRDFPIMGATAGFFGAAEAMEAIKFLSKKGNILAGKMLIVDLLSWECSIYSTTFNPNCPVCGGKK